MEGSDAALQRQPDSRLAGGGYGLPDDGDVEQQLRRPVGARHGTHAGFDPALGVGRDKYHCPCGGIGLKSARVPFVGNESMIRLGMLVGAIMLLQAAAAGATPRDDMLSGISRCNSF